MYWKDQLVNNTSPSTFTVLGHGYAEDNKQVYFRTSVVNDADPATFKVFPHDFGDADAEYNKNRFIDGRRL